MRRLRPETVYLIYETGGGFMFRLMSTVYTVFIVVRLDPTPFQLLMLGTVLEGTYLLFEVPTGVVADTMGRRISVVIGVLGTGVAFVVLGVADSFAIAVVSQVMFGIFATFQSGADVAWLTDEIGEEAARPLYVRAEQWYQWGRSSRIAASVALVLDRPPAPRGPVRGSASSRWGSSSRSRCARKVSSAARVPRVNGCTPPSRRPSARAWPRYAAIPCSG